MGLISKIKELFSAKKYILRVMEEMDRRNAELAALPNEELASLSDGDLCSAILWRIDRAVEDALGIKASKAEPSQAITCIGAEAATVYTLACWESELADGGLCHFLTGECSALASRVSEDLALVGADGHHACLQSFLSESGITLPDPTIHAENEFEYAEQKARHPYDDFDREYGKLVPLESLIAAYIRQHLASF